MGQYESATELFRSLSTISEDEGLMKKATRYLKKLAEEYHSTRESETLPAELQAKLERAHEQIKNGNCTILNSPQQISSWLNSL